MGPLDDNVMEEWKDDHGPAELEHEDEVEAEGELFTFLFDIFLYKAHQGPGTKRRVNPGRTGRK